MWSLVNNDSKVTLNIADFFIESAVGEYSILIRRDSVASLPPFN